ncbi:amino acid ABC transporter permease [Glutamicibacter endophyticus]|uniref:amino acid ABC transporter permease n=1 Tax=Glutamicibacter sp. PS TaxID=3075634 RepID=UPI00284D44D5|nr:amino acid ABC transporter permease [Glutamicibacter sp. PS]MDR4532139.1 amino acid ABC transporter permease [Glutamicibacter sp. PS]
MAMTARERARVSKIAQIAIFIIVVAILLISMNWPKVLDSFFAFDKIGPMFPDLLIVGLKNTIFYTAISFAFGLTLGLILALMKMASFGPYRWFATGYIEFFRGVPALLVLLALGYGLPSAFPEAKWPYAVVVMVSLGLVAAAYIAETLRAGLQAVPKGQTEAARSLGMPAWRAMVTIVIPQAFRIVLPPLTNEIILLTKDTSLAFILGSVAGQYELTKFGRDGITSLGAGITPLVVAGAVYLVITVPLSLLTRRMESKTGRGKR